MRTAPLLLLLGLAGQLPLLALPVRAVPVLLLGRVLDEDGGGLAGAAVELRSVPSPEGAAGTEAAARTETDPRGRFRLQAPAAGRWWLRLAAPGSLPMRLEIDAAPPSTGLPTVRLPRATELAVVVVDGRGRPIPGVAVTARARLPLTAAPELADRLARPAPRRAVSDDAGRLTLPRARGEALELSADAPGYCRRGSVAVDPTAPRFRLVLDRPRSVFGKVVDWEGRPLRGVHARLTPAAGPGLGLFHAASRQEPGGSVDTEADGRFTIAGLPPGTYDLVIERAGFAPARVPSLEVPAGDGPFALGTVALALGAELTGRVTDPRGEPLAGVVIDLELDGSTRDTRSDAAGRFTFSDLVAGQALAFEAALDGYAPARLAGVELPLEEPLTVVLEPAGRVTGWVVDAEGTPVAGAAVALSVERAAGTSFGTDPQQWTVNSTAAGDFSFSDLPPGQLELRPRVPGLPPGEVVRLQLAAGEEVTDLVLRLPPTVVIEGRVETTDGAPVEGAMVLVGPPGAARGGVQALTDAAGFYETGALAVGPHRVEARGASLQPAVTELVAASGRLRVDLVLEAGLEVGGRVVASDGRPVAGARLSLVAEDGDLPPVMALAAADGGFLARGVAAGSYRLRASADGFADVELPLVVGENLRGVEVWMAAGATLHGRLRGATLAQLADARVWALGPRGSSAASPVAHDGGYRFEHLASGRWELRAMLPAARRQLHRSVEVEAGTARLEVDLELERGLNARGVVRLAGRPVAGAPVRIVDPASGGTRGSAVTQPAGRFEIGGLAAGGYTIQIGLAAGLRYSAPLEIDGDRDVSLDIPTLRLTGWTIDSLGRGVADVELSLEAMAAAAGTAGARGRTVTRSRSDGSFAFDALPAGRYRIRASKPGYAALEKRLGGPSGGALDGVELTLEPAGTAAARSGRAPF